MILLHQPGETIAQRYRVIDTLGQGGIGITYEAEDLNSSQRVALKAVSLRRTDDAKVLELFEREARILAQLNHLAIPRYLDYFQVNKRRHRFFYLAQQLAQGKSLAVLLEKGWQPAEAEVRRIATQILEILVYLQQLTPPVLHRDIKPQNIICRDDGRVFLVDFGAVQDVYHNSLTGGSTVAGTYGYMAPEQFRGQAVLATDLYALGATLISLLSHKAPVDLPHRKLKIDFRPHVKVTNQFANWLERMIEPVAEDRFLSAEEALAVLRGKKEFTLSATQKFNRSPNIATAKKVRTNWTRKPITANYFFRNSLIFVDTVIKNIRTNWAKKPINGNYLFFRIVIIILLTAIKNIRTNWTKKPITVKSFFLRIVIIFVSTAIALLT